MNYSARLTALRQALPKLKCDALAVSNLTNVRYLCGYTGTSGLAVVSDSEAFFITDFRYQAQAAAQVPAEYSILIAEKGLWKEAARLLKKKAARVGFEAEHLAVAAWQEITEQIKPAELVSTLRAVEELRLIKDQDELEIIRRAVRVADEAFASVVQKLRPGRAEWEVAEELRVAMQGRGASGPSFTTIVASGARSALPHGVASDKKLEKGDLVTVDMGAIVDGYCSDMTRTVCLGRPTREQQKIYRTVWRAQVAAVEALRPGLGCKEADAIARRVIEEAGYGEAFGHGLGHGVGLDIHEAPRLSRLGKGKLQRGMVVTAEPGIYVEGTGGVRIEDMLVITADGAEILTGTPKPEKLLEV
jgi:Xaa-Pro aminopeptidase